MPIENEPYTTYDQGWILRVKKPVNQDHPRVLLLLHGWTGDETVMWIFTRSLPDNLWILAPRGPVKAPENGYGWLPHHTGLPGLQEFEPVAHTLHQAVHRWMTDLHIADQPINIMGFSQGAAMAYALTAFYPQQVDRLIALAGFLPEDETTPGRYTALSGKQVYIAHGTLDDTIPVAFAHEAIKTLKLAGADVTYCESEVGHKMGAGCLKGLTEFFD